MKKLTSVRWKIVAATLSLCTCIGFVALASESPPFRNSDEVEDGQWLTAAKDYANTRYSGLGEISKDNAARLQVAWTFSTGINRGQEAAPLVVGKTMYVATPYPNILYALDLADGTMKWKYEAKPAAIAQGVACCDFVTRGAAYWDGTVIINSLDAHTIGVDAETGQQRWKTKLGEVRLGETMTMAPFVVDGRVYVGNSGADFGVRGWLACLDAKDGKILWRAYSTGPDKDCLIGDDFKPFYASDKGKDLGVKSWPPGRWQTGGGRAWGWVSYDPELKLIYYGTSNPAPWNSHERPGDNKWTSGIFARNAENGTARWFYQYSPHDLWDHDGINESVLLDLEINGQKRKVLVHPDRNGYMYVMDRTTGEVLSATAFVRINATKEVDLKTGRLIYSEDKQPEVGKVIRDVAPSVPGGKDWTPSAYSPKTGWLYMPHLNMTMDLEEVDVNYVAGLPYVGVNEKFYAGPGGHAGEFTAWDPVNAKAVWQLHERFPVWSGALVTAGDVVFYGTLEGWFKAVDAHTGKLLWKFKTGSGICGQPITYRGPDGRQYVAVLSGVGGWAGVVVSGGLDTRDPNGANGFVNAVKELPKLTTKGGTLYVFALPANQNDSEAKP